MPNTIEDKKAYFEKENIKYVEFSTTKENGGRFSLIMEQKAFKKLSQKKIKYVKEYNKIKEIKIYE